MSSLLFVATLRETNNQDWKTIYPWTACPGVRADCIWLTRTLREKRVGSGGASWASIFEQGRALDELIEMKTSIEREAQGESGGGKSPPTASTAEKAAVPPSSELSSREGIAARREGGIPAEAVQQQLKPRDWIIRAKRVSNCYIQQKKN